MQIVKNPNRCELCNVELKNEVIQGKLKSCQITHQIYWAGAPVMLSYSQRRIIHMLAGSVGRVYTRAQMMDFSGIEWDISDRAVDSRVKHLRHKFKKVDPKFNQLETVRNVGYRWRPEDE